MSKPGILFNELIDQYKLEKHLSQKRVTDHFVAFDVDENDQVSIEILLPSLANDQKYSNRFISKIQSVAQLNHPNIAQIFQVGVAPNKRPYFAREFIEGISLKERFNELKNQDHPVHSIYALKLVRQITDALSLAERLDIFHHDLNPENILFQSDGKITLVDIGIPRIPKNENDQFLGNINFDTRYWSPEQIQNKSIDARSHVYSLGVILFEVLTGHVIQETSPSGSILSRQGNKSALEKLRSDLAPETVRLVQKALRTSPRSRFNNCSDLLAAIDEAIQAEEFVLHSGNIVGQRRPIPRLLLTVGAPILLVLLATIIGFILVRNGNDTAVDDGEITPPAIAVEPTQIPIQPTDEPTPTLTVEADTPVPPVEQLALVSPQEGETIVSGDFVILSWTWAELLEENQEFIIVGTYDDDQFVFEDATISTNGNNHEAAIPIEAFDFQEGIYQWQIILLSSITRTAIAQSDTRSFIFESTATATPTLTLTPTNTPTFTPSPTIEVPPEVRIILSSVSLRSGPSTQYDILRFLLEGDVVQVIGRNSEGTWINVVTEDNLAGWLSISVAAPEDGTDLDAVPTAATIPAVPTATNTSIPTATPTFTPEPPPSNGGGGDSGGGGGGGGNNPPPTKTPPPP